MGRYFQRTGENLSPTPAFHNRREPFLAVWYEGKCFQEGFMVLSNAHQKEGRTAPPPRKDVVKEPTLIPFNPTRFLAVVMLN